MSKPTWRSDMTVKLDDRMGDDAKVIRMAKASIKQTGGDMDQAAREGFINFLMRERHGSPFEHAVFTFYVEAPIFVWREFMRHRIASYNEESGRYKQLEPVFYLPDQHRKLVQVGKAGAYRFEQGTEDQYRETVHVVSAVPKYSYGLYRHLLGMGIAREVARMVLPVNIYSSAFVTINARSLMNLLSLRVKSEDARFPSYPQREIEMVAEQMETIFADLLPATHQAFVENGRVAP